MEGGSEGGRREQRKVNSSFSHWGQSAASSGWMTPHPPLPDKRLIRYADSEPASPIWMEERACCLFWFPFLPAWWEMKVNSFRTEVQHLDTNIQNLEILKSWVECRSPRPSADHFGSRLSCDFFYLWHLMTGSEPQCGFILQLQRV